MSGKARWKPLKNGFATKRHAFLAAKASDHDERDEDDNTHAGHRRAHLLLHEFDNARDLRQKWRRHIPWIESAGGILVTLQSIAEKALPAVGGKKEESVLHFLL
ncbi:hypothetical protein DBV15_08603 [Temnothorax longispinosus]|uniref:Uncharacterized protein n=1 Tax=Temnothorax longispinosus TaxID=300112 RepID=A0A4S2KUQ7_9HYME|nr:hypothetical protein DBV15_08603 [Temnothorax longispinosus]